LPPDFFPTAVFKFENPGSDWLRLVEPGSRGPKPALQRILRERTAGACAARPRTRSIVAHS
jgi:hypothetical protein